MAIKGLDAREELAVVTQGDENLCVRADGGFEDGEGAGGEFVFLVFWGGALEGCERVRGGRGRRGVYLEFGDFIFSQLWGRKG